MSVYELAWTVAVQFESWVFNNLVSTFSDGAPDDTVFWVSFSISSIDKDLILTQRADKRIHAFCERVILKKSPFRTDKSDHCITCRPNCKLLNRFKQTIITNTTKHIDVVADATVAVIRSCLHQVR